MESTHNNETAALLMVNQLNLSQAKQALGLAEVNFFAVNPEAQADLAIRIAALKDRIRRLTVTDRNIARVNAALKANGVR